VATFNLSVDIVSAGNLVCEGRLPQRDSTGFCVNGQATRHEPYPKSPILILMAIWKQALSPVLSEGLTKEIKSSSRKMASSTSAKWSKVATRSAHC
jgi:hypothetical protein